MKRIGSSVRGGAEKFARDWSVPRQLAGEDPQSKAAESDASRNLRPRLEGAEKVGTSICPYCAVGWLAGVLGLAILGPLSLHGAEALFGQGEKSISKPRITLDATAMLVGGFILRAVLVFGGRPSADRPRDYFSMTSPKKRTSV